MLTNFAQIALTYNEIFDSNELVEAEVTRQVGANHSYSSGGSTTVLLTAGGMVTRSLLCGWAVLRSEQAKRALFVLYVLLLQLQLTLFPLLCDVN